jgi:hypothetical protein
MHVVATTERGRSCLFTERVGSSAQPVTRSQRSYAEHVHSARSSTAIVHSDAMRLLGGQFEFRRRHPSDGRVEYLQIRAEDAVGLPIGTLLEVVAQAKANGRQLTHKLTAQHGTQRAARSTQHTAQSQTDTEGQVQSRCRREWGGGATARAVVLFLKDGFPNGCDVPSRILVFGTVSKVRDDNSVMTLELGNSQHRPEFAFESHLIVQAQAPRPVIGLPAADPPLILFDAEDGGRPRVAQQTKSGLHVGSEDGDVRDVHTGAFGQGEVRAFA